MRDVVRFRPPRIEASAELNWVLGCAFGALDGGDASPDLDVATAVALAARLGLAGRLATRLGVGAAELAATPHANALARESHRAAASMLRATVAARHVARLAAGRGIDCCFLKGVALEALSLSPSGGRAVADLDVLVDERSAAALAGALGADGFVSAGEAYPHQLAALVHPSYGSVEIHVHLPGVVAPGATRFARFDELLAAGLLGTWSGMPAAARLPEPPLLAAHLLAHALGQHGFRPDGYPAMRLLGDLLDLGAAREDGDELMVAALGLLSPLVPAAEARAAFAATRALASGDVAIYQGDSPAGRLLRHLLAAELDDSYREALKLQDLGHPLREGNALRRWAATARHALLLSRSQVDAIYGPPRSRWGYAARRILRPLDLARRAGRALLSHRPPRRS